MRKLGLNVIRSKFLDFFEDKNHFRKGSFSLVPEDDKTLLLINAGMAPLKPYFMGTKKVEGNRMVTCQKCIRTGDIENVGITARHATFFEMLGNFSFGDYFKEESIKWGWEFVTEHLKMPLDRLWVTVYKDDDDAYDIWKDKIGVPEDRIVRLGKEDNFWEIATGPCGPCSEIYYDMGEKFGCDNPDCKPGCECDRYVEFWNHVFTQFEKDEEGNYHNLPKPNIDTGMGLERVACIMQGVDSIFEIDTIKHILNGVTKLAKKNYGDNDKEDISIRIITDHIKAVVFMVADGILPSNEGRGYILRRLLRRAARHGKLIGIQGSFLPTLIERVVESYGEAYPALVEKRDYIEKVITVEEEKFQKTIDQGIDILQDYVMELVKEGKTVLPGDKAFMLYDTYGFPLDLTREILEEEKLSIDEEGFEIEMENQRNRARSARKGDDVLGWAVECTLDLGEDGKSEFIGYDKYDSTSEVSVIIKNGEVAASAVEGEDVQLVLEKTPFYPEGGGQSGDKGTIKTKGGLMTVFKTIKNGDCIIHNGRIDDGIIRTGEAVEAQVSVRDRLDSAKNHSATHLLHKVLKDVLGSHVEQKGSQVNPEKLRFDFTNFESMTKEEIEIVEKKVNEAIFNALNLNVKVTSIGEAKAMGATALFGEKYGETVRVVDFGGYSVELCGGTHVANTIEIGMFKILSESGVAAGVRRIEAITGSKVYEYLKNVDDILKLSASKIKASPNEVLNRLDQINDELKRLSKENDGLKNKLATSSLDDILSDALVINGVTVVTAKLDNMEMDGLRNLADKLRDKYENSLVVLASDNGGKVNIAATASKDAVKQGVHCGNIIREVAKVTGGGGGGRPNMAQAGGKNPAKIEEALSIVAGMVEGK